MYLLAQMVTNTAMEKYAVDVLGASIHCSPIPAKDPNSVALIKQSNPNIKSNPFRAILPKPNWKIDL